MRDYDPTTGRYIQADPLGLVDGASVYGYAGQNPGRFFDPRGEAYFALRPLDNLPWTPWSDSAWLGRLNIEFSHEQLFFEDGKSPSNLGFFEDSLVRPDRPHLFSEYKRARIGNYDDCLMRIAVSRVQMPRPTFETLGGFRGPNNCQVWAELVRLEYAKLRDDEEAKCTCGMN